MKVYYFSAAAIASPALPAIWDKKKKMVILLRAISLFFPFWQGVQITKLKLGETSTQHVF
jgi:hypothetical protein